MIMAAADRKIIFHPDDVRPSLKAAPIETILHDADLGPSVPDISHRAREQRPSLTPISPVIVLNLAQRAATDDPGSAGSPMPLNRGRYPPLSIVIHPIRRVGDHQVRLDAAEHALDVRRHRAVAAEEAMPALRHRGELRAALGAAALHFGGHFEIPRASATWSNVLPSSARTASRPANFDQRLSATSQ
jgi:hypothetical protein